MNAHEAEKLMYSSIREYGPTREKLYKAIKEAAQRCESSIRFTDFMEGNNFKTSGREGVADEPPIARLLVRDLKSDGFLAEISIIIDSPKTTKSFRGWEMDYKFSVDVRW